jgi:preprotein translocase subunit SecD
MSARLRKFIGLFAVLAFLAGYIVMVIAIADRLPQNWFVQLAVFGGAGIVWGLPLKPLFRWMNSGR